MIPLHAFDNRDVLTAADVVEGERLEPPILDYLARPEVAYLHAQYAKLGCFAGRIEHAQIMSRPTSAGALPCSLIVWPVLPEYQAPNCICNLLRVDIAWRARDTGGRVSAEVVLVLTGSKVILRHVEQQDLEELIRRSNETRARGDYVFTAMRSPGMLRKRFEEDGLSSESSETLVITTHEGAVVGQIGHFGTDHRFPEREIGYQIFAEENRGKRYASEAAALLVDYLFSSFAYNRLRAIINPLNIASARVVSRLGFKKEGTLRGLMLVAGRYVDQDLYGFLREDWFQQGRNQVAHTGE